MTRLYILVAIVAVASGVLVSGSCLTRAEDPVRIREGDFDLERSRRGINLPLRVEYPPLGRKH